MRTGTNQDSRKRRKKRGNVNLKFPTGLNNELIHFRFLGCRWQFWVQEFGTIFPIK